MYIIQSIIEIILMIVALMASVFAVIVGAINGSKKTFTIGLIVAIIFTATVTQSIIRLFAL